VSRICQCIDEELDKNWNINGIQKAIKIILAEQNTLFESLIGNIKNNQNLRDLLYDLLLVGEEKNFNINVDEIGLGCMYGFLKNEDSKVKVANKIFENLIYNYFIDEINPGRKIVIGKDEKSEIKKDGRFSMELCLNKFAKYYAKVFAENDVKFVENSGKKIFLMYLIPLINGEGFYHMESELNDLSRMDIVVDYGKEQFIIELKLWHGEKKHEDAYVQLHDYLEKMEADKGYLITFDLRKERNKQSKAEWIEFDGKQIFDIRL
jgi:hypothetical protein